MRSAERGAILFIALVLMIHGAAAPASAQYFGRQKVQYEAFDWRVIDAPHFEIHYYPESAEKTEDVVRMAERWYARLSRAFQHEFEQRPLIFYADHPDFQQTNVTPGMIGEGTGGFMEFLRGRVVMPYTGVYHDTHHVLGHELVHAFQHDLAMQPGGGGIQGLARMPGWLVEGMAEYMSIGRNDAHTSMWLRDAALRGELPTIQQLTRDTRFFPYRYGQALWAYIAGRWGDRAVPELFRMATRTGWEPAVQRVLGTTSEQISQDWITAIRAAYLPVIEGRQRPIDSGDPLLVDDEIGAMNIAPSISPDGRYVAFYGRRALFTTDLYLADAATGTIVRRLASPQQTPHYDALSFIASAGSWSPDGQMFAFVVFRQGRNELAILDVRTTAITRRIAVRGVGSIQNPAWSPDGTRIVFTGTQGGISDLYMLDLATESVQQLMNDRYADLQPAWSPDGRTLAFVTDRGPGTDFETLTFGPMQIGLMDVETRDIRVLEIFDGPKHINPQFSPDGTSLFFIADREGFSDIYRLELASGAVHQVTRLATGVSGITYLSPAMTVAAQTGAMAFSVFENSGNNIYALDAARTAGELVSVTPAERVVAAGLLPPHAAYGEGVIAQYLADPITGLPSPEVEYEERGYRPRIGLEYVGPPAFGVGVSDFGVGVAGGVSLYFADMLGDHTLSTVIQANGGIKDIGGVAAYNNQSRRWNWGGMVAHVPYLTGFQYTTVDTLQGQQVGVLRTEYRRTFINQAMAGTRYPFSMTRRFEFNAGYTRYGFDIEEYDLFFIGNQVIGDRLRSVPTRPAIHMATASAAYVGDNSYFAFTGPVSGERFRFEVSPSIGSLQFFTGLADYRRYLFLQPFTLAFRGLHYGRYGRDAEGIQIIDHPETGQPVPSRVLSPLFLGYETLIRGYNANDFDIRRECTPVPGVPLGAEGGCPEFDRLLGTRIGVASLEFRIPLFGVPEFGLLNFPFLPTEISPFIDAGVAWRSGDAPVWDLTRQSPERIPVFSTGVSARMNILGYLVLEAYYAYPFQRPERGWHWGFHIAPGW
jgi:Tol biopolymer transport system component